jgi:DNA replication protein DnaC
MENKSNLLNLQQATTTANQFSDPVQLVQSFRDFAAEHVPGFQIDGTNETAINYLAEIAAGTAAKPGLILHGIPGTGKTTLLLAWFAFLQSIEQEKRRLCLYGTMKLRRIFEQQGTAMFEPILGDVLILDDVSEITEGNHYGTRTNLIAELIYARYNSFKCYPGLETYMTTNLTFSELQTVLGQRAASRLLEMTEYNTGTILGDDRRKQPELLRKWPYFKLHDPLKPKDRNTAF